MSKKIIYTKHAKEMLEFRNIKKDFIEKCINNPDKILEGNKNKQIYLKDFGKNYLKIIVSSEKEIVVITCYWIHYGRIKE